MPKVVVTGAAGMLGRAVMEYVPQGVAAIGVTRADGDLALRCGVERAVVAQRPDTVIHVAAYTDVDGCERDPARAWRDNALATRLVCQACESLGARLVYVSTDYVFDGRACEPYDEGAATNPLNVYGETKLAGEMVAASVENSLIVRTQWLFGPGGRNFVAAILKRALDGEEMRAVADQTGCPTYTRHLARAIWQAAMSDHRGTVHIAGHGIATWLDLARAVLEAAGLQRSVRAISSEDWPSGTRRPRYTVLSQSRWMEWAGEALPSWRQGVAEYVRELLAERKER
jgi:dTDP-4-dehydrorhamnose reductase